MKKMLFHFHKSGQKNAHSIYTCQSIERVIAEPYRLRFMAIFFESYSKNRSNTTSNRFFFNGRNFSFCAHIEDYKNSKCVAARS